ncbi:MAG: hypothetical protein K1X67_19730 [Fimbriimonadaceae bacterium]|nr:hypothetical protein [Fimbriimonadaceae bacterium]
MSMIALLLAAASQPQAKTYSNTELDLSFQHPANWKVQTGKKGDSKIEIPLAGGGTATLELFAVSFREPAERWQEYQLMANQNLKRTIDRQWQEEILGSPLLMTRIFYTAKQQPMSTLVGLMYRAHPKKLNFRLTSQSSVYEEAEKTFRDALQSLRTVTGQMPEAENPDRIVETPVVVPKVDKPKPVTVLSAKDPGPGRLYKGRVKVPTKAAGRDVLLLLPDGWTATPESNKFILSRKGLNGTVKLEVAGVLDSPSAERALLAESAKALAEFAAVTLRDEPPTVTTKAGARLQSIRREGRTSAETLVVVNAAGASGDYYWILEYRIADPKLYRKDVGALDGLLQGASVTLAP